MFNGVCGKLMKNQGIGDNGTRFQKSVFAIDLETTDLDCLLCHPVGFAISWKEGEAYYLPVRAPAGEERLEEAALMSELKPLLEDPTIFKVTPGIGGPRLTNGIASGWPGSRITS